MKKKVGVTASISLESAQWLEEKAYSERRSQSSIIAEYIDRGIQFDKQKEKSQ